MARKCRGCKTEIPSVKDSMPVQKKGFCDFDCMAAHGLKLAKASKEKSDKKKLQQVKEADQRHKVHKKEFRANDTGKQLKLTQDVFNRMIKLERYYQDAKAGLVPECISCGKKASIDILGMFAAGHFKTVGAHNELRFNTLNVEFQCNRYCNKGLSGNIYGNKNTHGYIAGLELRYGKEQADKLISWLEQPHTDYTRNPAQLIIVRKWCAARTRYLIKEMGLD